MLGQRSYGAAYFQHHRPKRLGLRSTSPTSPTSSVAPPTLLRSAPLAALTPAFPQHFDLTLLLLDLFGCRALTAIRFPTRDEAIEELRQLVGCRPDGAPYPQPGPQAARRLPSTLLLLARTAPPANALATRLAVWAG